MTNEQDWLDAMYDQLKPWTKAASVGDSEMGALMSVEWADPGMADRLVQDMTEQLGDPMGLIHLLAATVMQYVLERRCREVDEERHQRSGT